MDEPTHDIGVRDNEFIELCLTLWTMTHALVLIPTPQETHRLVDWRAGRR